MDTAKKIQTAVRLLANETYANWKRNYFKRRLGRHRIITNILGLTSKEIKIIALKYSNLSQSQLSILLSSYILEDQIVAAEIMLLKYLKGSFEVKTKISNYFWINRAVFRGWNFKDRLFQVFIGDQAIYTKNYKRVEFLLNRNDSWDQRVGVVVLTHLILYDTSNLLFFKYKSVLDKNKDPEVHQALRLLYKKTGLNNKEK